MIYLCITNSCVSYSSLRGPASFVSLSIKYLKGQCHEIFCFRFFHESPSPKLMKIALGSYKFFQKFAEILASQGAPPRYQRHWWKIFHRCQRHWWQNCRRYQRHRRQIFPPVPLMLLIPVANLPPVSTIPAANLPPVSTTPVANCHRYQ